MWYEIFINATNHRRSIMREMRELIAEFASLQPRPEIAAGEILLLGREDKRPELRVLRENEQVVLTDPGNLRAIGIVVSRQYPDGQYWFGVVRGKVEDILPPAGRQDESD
jgi:hypothetical protein